MEPELTVKPEHIFMAYKKLKSSIYFDKTRPILRQRLVEYESEDIEADLTKIYALLSGNTSDDSWYEFENELLGSIRTLELPKTISETPLDLDEGDKKKKGGFSDAISNACNGPMTVDKNQYFIDMNVEGFILGMLWTLLIGVPLDSKMNECSYGNRIRSDLENNQTAALSYSPYLFEPYFSQYGNWRDKALDCAEKTLQNDHKDIVILTLDFASFYHSINYSESDFAELLKIAGFSSKNGPDQVIARLNNLIYKVLERYASLFDPPLSGETRHSLLPIGFAPSGILANWCMEKFDNHINERINPLYYGRYVDDIILVEKYEKNSKLDLLRGERKLDSKAVFEYFFSNCYRDSHSSGVHKQNTAFFKPKKTKAEAGKSYYVQPKLLHAENSMIGLQDTKVKVFLFDHDSPRALIQQFRETIAKNSSEFRLMPDIEGMSIKDNYSILFDLDNSETENKFRGINKIKLDNYELSKFLGRYERIGLILDDNSKPKFCRELTELFDDSSLIRYYTVWEKMFEIIVCSNDFELLHDFFMRILRTIDKIEEKFPDRRCHGPEKEAGCSQGNLLCKEALFRTAYSYFARATALSFGKKMNAAIAKLATEILNFQEALPESASRQWLFIDADIDQPFFTAKRLNDLRLAFCKTYMVDKYAMPILPAFVIPSVSKIPVADLETKLFDITECRKHLRALDENCFSSTYFPYMVKMQDLEFAFYNSYITNEEDIKNPSEIQKTVEKFYTILNYHQKQDSYGNDLTERINIFKMDTGSKKVDSFAIQVSDTHDSAISKPRVAIANVSMGQEAMENGLRGEQNLSHERYSRLASILNEAAKENADLVILPELYVPFSWIPRLLAFSANENISIVCGIEHEIIEGKAFSKAFNFTAVILPYEYDGFKYAKLTLHQKVHLSPAENKLLVNNHLEPKKGNTYELFCWKNIWFSVYCCYELTSIKERSMFQSYADILIAVEWNRDVNYFSNIIASLARDMSCYCLQVNDSKFGDSRIVQPSKTEEIDVIKVKGGLNSTILVAQIDIDKIRICQSTVDGGGEFKPPAPDFKHDMPGRKNDRTLANYLQKAQNTHDE